MRCGLKAGCGHIMRCGLERPVTLILGSVLDRKTPRYILTCYESFKKEGFDFVRTKKVSCNPQ
jgi:hypothetical protein